LSAAGVVAALALEARTLRWQTRRADGLLSRSDGTLVAVSGIGTAAAAIAAQRLVDAGVNALVSWGLAGGLDPTLTAGTICLPCVVLAQGGESYATDPRFREILRSAIAARGAAAGGTVAGGTVAGGTVAGGKLLTSAQAIDAIAAKARAFLETGAVAVDMESAGVAAVAARRGLPFIAVRVIVDAAGDAVPEVALAASREGEVRILPVLLGILKSPRQMAPLLRLSRRLSCATRSLAAVAGSGALAPRAYAAASPTPAA
jgi:adenosylhomocysteine nucleosidase